MNQQRQQLEMRAIGQLGFSQTDFFPNCLTTRFIIPILKNATSSLLQPFTLGCLQDQGMGMGQMV